MRLFMVFLGGIVVSVVIGRMLTGCCAGAMSVVPVQPGKYSFAYAVGGDAALFNDTNYQLVLDSDKTHVTETFTRNGKNYSVQYHVVSRGP